MDHENSGIEEQKRLAEVAEELVSANDCINVFTLRAALTTHQEWRISKWKNLTAHKNMTFKTAFDPVKALANDKAKRESRTKAADTLAGLKSNESKPTTSPASCARDPEQAHRIRSRFAAASAATQQAPIASSTTTRSEDWPIRLPRIIPAPATSMTDKPFENVDKTTSDNNTINKTTLNTVPSKQPKKPRHRSRKTIQLGGDYEMVGHDELDDEFDMVDSKVPSAENGSAKSDPDSIIDSLESAFRTEWEYDE